MVLYPDCDYHNDLQGDEYSPYTGECEDCYRYAICKSAYDREHKQSGERICKTTGQPCCECRPGGCPS